MKVSNVHSRKYPVSARVLGELLDTLSSPTDRLWPHEYWPPMRLDGLLAVGTSGGHKPIRYVIQEYEQDKILEFRFLHPKGFCGTHSFEIIHHQKGLTELEHRIDMVVEGSARVFWPLIIRPLHDALVEDAFAKISKEIGLQTQSAKWSRWVKILRWVMSGGKARSKSA